MQSNWSSKRDWLLFRNKIAGWQEAYIGRLNKEYIAVDEKGTKAGAATAIEAPAAGNWEDRRRVILDRPVVYAIIDDAAGLPIFIGAVTDIQK